MWLLSRTRICHAWAGRQSRNFGRSWVVAWEFIGGKPLYLRLNMGLKAGDPKFPYQAVFAMTFQHPSADGMPQQTELSKADPIEDQLANFVAKNHAGKFACIQTHGGQRKFLFYFSSEDLARRAQSTVKTDSHYKLDLKVRKDPGWSIYKGFHSDVERQQQGQEQGKKRSSI